MIIQWTFRGLDVVDEVLEEPGTEVHSIVQQAVIKTISKKKECKMAKILSEEALKITDKRRERVRYTQLNAEFKRRAKRDKKAFFNKQCKEIEENNRMGKTGDFFKKIGDIKGILHGRMGKIKDRNRKDLKEAEEIKKRLQEYTEELHKKCLYDPDNCNGGVTHQEPDILECEIQQALGSITMNRTTGGDEIPAKLFQIL